MQENITTKYRELTGMSRQELADLIGVHMTTIYRWETKPEHPIPKRSQMLLERLVQEKAAQ